MEQRRREVRHNLAMYLECIRDDSGEKVGKIIDITSGGMLLLSRNKMAIGSRGDFHITLPHLQNLNPQSITCGAECHWAQEAETPGYFYMGLAYLDPDAVSTETIDAIVQRLGFSDGQKRIHSPETTSEYR